MKQKINVHYVKDDQTGQSRLYRWNLCQLYAKFLLDSEVSTQELENMVNYQTEQLNKKKK